MNAQLANVKDVGVPHIMTNFELTFILQNMSIACIITF